MYIHRFPKEEVLVWLGSTSGTYTVKYRYLFLIDEKGITRNKLLGGSVKIGVTPQDCHLLVALS